MLKGKIFKAFNKNDKIYLHLYMLTFFIPKVFLRDLIPNDFVDIHSHLLPGIDDGAKNIGDSLSLIQELQKIGFEQFITTPHIMTSVWDNTRSSINDSLEITRNELKNKNVNVKINAAAEYLIDTNFITLFKTEQLLTLKENYVLVEISYFNPPLQLFEILFELQIAGYKPILAHPERYSYYHNNFSEYKKLKKSGCLFQLNLLSTIGYYGKSVAETATKLLNLGMIDFVGSDVHHENHILGFSKKIISKDNLPLKEAIDRNHFFRKT